MKKIDTVLFDLDQTLLDKDQSLINFAKYQYEEFSLVRFISDKQDFVDKFFELNHIVMPKEEVFEKLADIFKIEKSLSTVLLDDLNNNFHNDCVGFPGLHQMLETLKQQSYKLGVITNGRDFYQRNKINALGILDYFNEILTSGAIHIKKPDHAIFHLALTKLKSSSECSVFVGDNLKSDIIPAMELGMYTILKTKNYDPYPTACCDNLMDIPKLIKHFC
ncbi:HAD family hydrolase [Paenibacillus ginsengarvi]|uniref:HAD family hydrolase n=1 Tax=Paenibacillus ginsengarvi TaxID=400777 RepID=A0A3B0CMG6_9BACL|nr:HAD family hydrolase [Paenibacillus ginsengarvi]RKN86150.1 HAD family hydrolase [Paenibacillus ginsengarvi]